MNNTIQTVSFIGSGNVATQMAKAFNAIGIKVLEVISQHPTNAQQLASILNASVPDSIETMQKVDLLCIAVKDDVMPELVSHLTGGFNAIVHTSGSVDMKVLVSKAENVGVFYPVQSFRKNDNMNWSEIPICVEANNDSFTDSLFSIAGKLSNQVAYLNSTQRIQLHIAAVMVNNFTNYLYSVSHDLVVKQHLSFSLLLPLIKASANKLSNEDPWALQTGPAIRQDIDIIQKHIKLLDGNPEAKELYKFISEHIIKKASDQ